MVTPAEEADAHVGWRRVRAKLSAGRDLEEANKDDGVARRSRSGAQDVFIGARTGVISTRRESDNTVYLAVPIRNVGPGTAILATPNPSVLPRGDNQAAYAAKVNALAVPPAAAAYVLLSSNTAGAGGGFDPTGGNFRVEVAYRDAAGGQHTRAQLYVDPHLRVVGIAVFHGHEPTPFLSYGETQEDWPA